MNCKEIENVLIDYLDHSLPAETAKTVEKHLDSCSDCRLKTEQTRVILMQIASAPMHEPDETLSFEFEKMLEQEIKALQNETKTRWMARPWVRMSLRVAAGILLLITGFGLGLRYNARKANPDIKEMSAMQSDMKEMKQMLMFSLLKQESASERIKAVNYVDEMSNPDEKVIKALFNTLDFDKNPNVRLAAAYSLSRFGNVKTIRDQLVSSLAKQTEPIVQITLINMLVELREVKAIEPIQEILHNKTVIKEVKEQADKGLKRLNEI